MTFCKEILLCSFASFHDSPSQKCRVRTPFSKEKPVFSVVVFRNVEILCSFNWLKKIIIKKENQPCMFQPNRSCNCILGRKKKENLIKVQSQTFSLINRGHVEILHCLTLGVEVKQWGKSFTRTNSRVMDLNDFLAKLEL